MLKNNSWNQLLSFSNFFSENVDSIWRKNVDFSVKIVNVFHSVAKIPSNQLFTKEAYSKLVWRKKLCVSKFLAFPHCALITVREDEKSTLTNNTMISSKQFFISFYSNAFTKFLPKSVIVINDYAVLIVLLSFEDFVKSISRIDEQILNS